ncbi:MAG: hypothetical protein ACYDBB_02765 [Armatimonadota bacterium]
MLWGARRVTIRISADAPVPLDTARVVWGDGDRLDLPRDQMALLQAGTAVLLSHVYGFAPTPYVLLFSVVDTEGQQATATAGVTVCNTKPHLTMTIGIDAHTVTVIPIASDPDGEIIDISLYWGGREGALHGARTGEPLSHEYPEGGLWDILATASDDEGASVAVRQYVALQSDAEAATRWGISPGARCQERNDTP